MKNVRPALFEDDQVIEVVTDEDIGRSTLSGWIINDEYVILCDNPPKFDPYTGEPLTLVEDADTN